MQKVYRILGERGRTTVPYALRIQMGIRPNDVISFRREDDEIIIKREKICDNCAAESSEDTFSGIEALHEYLDSLPEDIQTEVLRHLFVNRLKFSRG